MADKHDILYIMRSVHIDGRIFVNDKKVGVTGKGNATLKARISQLSSTKNNFGAQCIAAWRTPPGDDNSTLHYETQIHKELVNQMVPCSFGSKTEWFYDDGDNQIDVVQFVVDFAERNNLQVVDVGKLQDENTKALSNRAMKACFENVYSLVSTFSTAEISKHKLTSECVRITTSDGRSFHINVRADLNKQYISISKTKHDIERYSALCKEESFVYDTSKRSGNIKVYVKTPRQIARVIDAFFHEGL